MTDRQLLRETLDYDLWANLQWHGFLTQATAEEAAVFGHILSSQKVWADRVAGESPTGFPEIEATETNIRTGHETWVALLESVPLERVIAFKRMNGDAHSLEFGQILRHVLNHHTYHRGHLRGLCQGRGCEDFPETDLLLHFLM